MRLLLISILLLMAPLANAATHRFALVVGQNSGHDPTRVLRFAEHDARKVSRTLVQLGGFPKKQVVLLTNTSADALIRALKKLEGRIARVAQRAQDRALVVFYYSGHADADRLELGKSTLAFSKISSFLKQSKATVRLAWIDSCFSGRLVTAKGARPKAGFSIRVTDQLESRGYAVITSSAADEASQESAEVRGSLFTHYLVSGLRGAADASRDGRVTLSETYRYVYGRTVARTSAHVGGGQHPTYDFQLQGRGEVVLTQLKKRSSHLVVQSPDVGRVVVIDQRKEQMLAEADVLAGHPAHLALPPGDYIVYLLEQGTAYRARTRLASGATVALTRERHFRPHALHEAVAKGGLFRPIWSSHLSAAGLVRRGPLGDQPVTFGTGLLYRLELPSGW
ncbi:MAG: caspase family protein, partial [Deltaproteobacteria bacterium]|nr:caspase family protein [Deltaproteobacteria bacterium]